MRKLINVQEKKKERRYLERDVIGEVNAVVIEMLLLGRMEWK